jgi:hypothetical protein
MKKGLCYIVFVIDRSGSMSSIQTDMTGGFNSFISDQKNANLGDCRVFAYKFDTEYEPMFENADLNNVPLLDATNYVPRGCTALYDSLGRTITNIGAKLAEMAEDERPEKVLVVTITDGLDNALLMEKTHYTAAQVKEMVQHQTEKYNWDFAYIGANQDAWAVGSLMGVSRSSSLNYTADSAGTALAFESLADSTISYRSSVRSMGAKAAFKFEDKKDKKDEEKTTA